MGKVEWAAYKPEDINYEARSRVEAWGRDNNELRIPPHAKSSTTSTIGGVLLSLTAAGLLIATYIRLF